MMDTPRASVGGAPSPSGPELKALGPLLVLGVVVYTLWALWALWLRGWTPSGQDDTRWGILARLVAWVIPSAMYLRLIWGRRCAFPLGLGFPLGRVQVRRALVLGLVTTWALFLATAARNGTTFNAEVLRFIGLAEPRLVAPIFEELVFRGVFLSEVLTWTHRNSRTAWGLRGRYWIGQLGCAVFFVALHWPSWWGYLGAEELVQRSVPVFAVAMVLGFVFAHTRSIWPCIWLHWLNNELSLMG